MTNTKSRGDCPAICWGLAGLAALLTFVLLLAVAEWRFIAALLVAILLLVGLGLLFKTVLCGSQAASGQGAAAPARSGKDAVKAPAVAPQGTPETAPKAAPVDVADPLVRPSAPLAGEAELAGRKGSWTYSETATLPGAEPAPPVVTAPDGDAAVEPAEVPDDSVPGVPVPDVSVPDVAVIDVPEDAGPRILPSTPLTGEAELASRKGTWTYTAPAADPAPILAQDPEDYDKDGIVEGTDEGEKPTMLNGPRDGGADDLKQVKGIGPKLEKLCNDLGIYHFDQIASWTDQEIAWVDANLEGFKGRVSRDQWVSQARVLAEGGETEFSSRVRDGNVY
ncbi:hypothetical protein [Antarctobacter heliothermus]|uniref:Predicted 5' DNA nuclease, flap endonuclease-1-like, helix-3-turn-helix (H3TH) domain n=1 Tax=Antarctobacter heliothermus TaxID=74033 RepID=A0A239D406_9RHOB|nr:hypothetical protein [Antarctobacter heliothermus]SNS27070.1 Predicted 5' DNA nuclease, flap endonuclease-1-like, helix-3-turn-helix (H3TH) domain [Antarctobacter heliothermus]